MSITHATPASPGGLSAEEWDAEHVGTETMPGYELDYVEVQATVNITATSAASATTIITGSAVAYDGATIILIECGMQLYTAADDRQISLNLYDGSTEMGVLGEYRLNAETAADTRIAVRVARRLTPSAGAHTYSVRAFANVGSSVQAFGAAGTAGLPYPISLRITRV